MSTLYRLSGSISASLLFCCWILLTTLEGHFGYLGSKEAMRELDYTRLQYDGRCCPNGWVPGRSAVDEFDNGVSANINTAVVHVDTLQAFWQYICVSLILLLDPPDHARGTFRVSGFERSHARIGLHASSIRWALLS
ncbi:hypothetical protein BKA93DRAFT_812526 [Sparassis latifolia]